MKNPEKEISLEERLPLEATKWYRQSPRIYSPNGDYLGRSLGEEHPKPFLAYLRLFTLPLFGLALGGSVGLVLGSELAGVMVTSLETHKVLTRDEGIYLKKK